MSIGSGRSASRRLTHVSLELMPRRAAVRRLAWPALVMTALVVGAATGYVGHSRAPVIVQAPSVDLSPALRRSREQLDRATLALRMADARSQELERQVDALNQRLRESNEELTFLRKAREGRHP